MSARDPVTHGVHCALGGDDFSFLVTSTLASQAPAAVGRALGSSLAHQLNVASKFEPDFVSLVSMGDGSVHNAHALSAFNLAEYAKHRNFKCPVVFVISDNNLSISLPGYNWVRDGLLNRTSLPVYQADGSDMFDAWDQTSAAVKHAREAAAPVLLVYNSLARRFGHAATDRQSAYLTTQQIKSLADSNPLAGRSGLLCSSSIDRYNQSL